VLGPQPTARTRTSAPAYYAQTKRAKPHLLSMVSKLQRARAVVQQPAGPSTRGGALDERVSRSRPPVIIKHNNPCGVAVGTNLEEGLRPGRWPPNPLSALRRRSTASNRPVERPLLAEKLASIFVELVFAPGYEPEGARESSRGKPNVADTRETRKRRLEPAGRPATSEECGAGLLVQDRNEDVGDAATRCALVTERKPERGGVGARLLFAWKVCKHVRSNAIRHSQGPGPPWGSGAGQMSRVDSVRAGGREGAARQSTGRGPWRPTRFFSRSRDGSGAGHPGRRSVDHPAPAARKRDDEVIEACNTRGRAFADGVRAPEALPATSSGLF